MSKISVLVAGFRIIKDKVTDSISTLFRGRRSAAATVPEFAYKEDESMKRGQVVVRGHSMDLETTKPLLLSLKTTPPKPPVLFDTLERAVVVTGVPEQALSATGFYQAWNRYGFDDVVEGMSLMEDERWDKVAKLAKEAKKKASAVKNVDVAAPPSSPSPPVSKKGENQGPMVQQQDESFEMLGKLIDEISQDVKELVGRGGGATSTGKLTGNGRGSGSDSSSDDE